MNKRLDILNRKEEILEMIKENKPLSDIYRKLKCKATTLTFYLKVMGINYSGNRGLKGIKISGKRKLALDYIKTDNPHSHIIKIKLLEDKIKEHKCELCGMKEWNNLPIPLELHHIDGNHFNNELSNLQLLCPNCHAQEPNNSGKAQGNYR